MILPIPPAPDIRLCSDEEYARLSAQALARWQTQQEKGDWRDSLKTPAILRAVGKKLRERRSNAAILRVTQIEKAAEATVVSDLEYLCLTARMVVTLNQQQEKRDRQMALLNSPATYFMGVLSIALVSLWLGLHHNPDVQIHQSRAHLNAPGRHDSARQRAADSTNS